MIFRTENGRADNINRSIFRKRERNTHLHPLKRGLKSFPLLKRIAMKKEKLQIVEFFYSNPSLADQFIENAGAEFIVLRDR
jgi:hypothetical protein